MNFSGVDWLGKGLHLLTQGLLIPVYLLLFFAVITILVDLGIFFRQIGSHVGFDGDDYPI